MLKDRKHAGVVEDTTLKTWSCISMRRCGPNTERCSDKNDHQELCPGRVHHSTLMSNLHLNVNTSGGGSPGSSVFDLPVSVAKDQHSPSPARLLPPANTEQAANNSISFVVLSGGTGGNAICSAFGNACYVLPVSDDGGSSSEIIRVIGGPSIGIYVSSYVPHQIK